MRHDTLISERPVPINDAARHDLDRDIFAAAAAALQAESMATYERRRTSWIGVTGGMRELGITDYPPEYVGDIRLVPIGRRNNDGDGAA